MRLVLGSIVYRVRNCKCSRPLKRIRSWRQNDCLLRNCGQQLTKTVDWGWNQRSEESSQRLVTLVRTANLSRAHGSLKRGCYKVAHTSSLIHMGCRQQDRKKKSFFELLVRILNRLVHFNLLLDSFSVENLLLKYHLIVWNDCNYMKDILG